MINTIIIFNNHMRTTQTKKTIGDYSFFLKDKIGSGSSSDVFRGLSLKTSEAVAVKVIPVIVSSKSTESDRDEIQVLSKLKDSQNIIQLRGAIKTKNNSYIITELCEGGTLEQELALTRRFNDLDACRVMQQVLEGVKEMIRVGFVHRDLKPSNIFRKGNIYKLGDFGYAMDAKFSGQTLRENVGSPSYMALESLKLNQYSHQSDFWALGVIFFQLLTGRTPWKARTQKALVQQIQQFKLEKALSPLLSSTSKQFLERTLVVDVDGRMSVDQFMEWRFDLGEEDSEPKILIHKPMRSTIDLRNVHKIKGILANKNSLNLEHIVQLPSSPIISETQMETLNFKKHNNSDEAKKIELAVTMHTITINEKDTHNSPKAQNTPQQITYDLSFTPRIARPIEPQTPRFQSGDVSCIGSQVQAQADYARFLLRLVRKVGDNLRTKDPRVIELRQSLLYFLTAKIQELKELRFLKASSAQKELYMSSPHYASLQTVISKYAEKAKEEGQKLDQTATQWSQNEFMRVLTNVMGLLYSNVAPLRTNLKQLQRKKAVLLILQDLVALSKLFLLQRVENWTDFRDQSGIDRHINRTPPEALSLSYFQNVLSKYMQLAQS